MAGRAARRPSAKHLPSRTLGSTKTDLTRFLFCSHILTVTIVPLPPVTSSQGTVESPVSPRGAFSPMWAERGRRRRHSKKNLIAAVVSSASDVARAPVRMVVLAVASLALLLMLFRRGLQVTMMMRSCLPPC